jgi:hypothetical protein
MRVWLSDRRAKRLARRALAALTPPLAGSRRTALSRADTGHWGHRAVTAGRTRWSGFSLLDRARARLDRHSTVAADAATFLLDQTARGATALHLGLGRRTMNRVAYHARRLGLAPVVGAAGGDEQGVGSARDEEYASAFGASPLSAARLSRVEEPGNVHPSELAEHRRRMDTDIRKTEWEQGQCERSR